MRKLLSNLLFLLLLLPITCFAVVVEISTWAELQAISSGLNGDYILVNDIDEDSTGYDTYASSSANSGAGWSPVGTFTGSLDGDGYKISGVFINRNQDKVGLFSWIQHATVEKVRMENVNITGKMIGALAGYGDGVNIVSQCYVTGTLASQYTSGTMIGFWNNLESGSKISNCYSSANITVAVERVGGLVGYWGENLSGTTTFEYSYAVGSVGTGSGDVNKSGGTTGEKNTNPASHAATFWDTQTSGRSASALSTGKTTSQMKDFDTFNDAGWDIVLMANHDGQKATAVWYIDDGNDYPRLWFEYTGGGGATTIKRMMGVENFTNVMGE